MRELNLFSVFWPDDVTASRFLSRLDRIMSAGPKASPHFNGTVRTLPKNSSAEIGDVSLGDRAALEQFAKPSYNVKRKEISRGAGMPAYEYECETCSHHFERRQKMSDPPITVCPECRGSVKRLISGGAGMISKGSVDSGQMRTQACDFGGACCGQGEACCGDMACEE